MEIFTLLIIVSILLVLLVVGAIAVYLGTKNKTKWGINTKLVNCPKCNTPPPVVRKPKNMQQTLWGGYTCSSCSAEIDKWGLEIESEKP